MLGGMGHPRRPEGRSRQRLPWEGCRKRTPGEQVTAADAQDPREGQGPADAGLRAGACGVHIRRPRGGRHWVWARALRSL